MNKKDAREYVQRVVDTPVYVIIGCRKKGKSFYIHNSICYSKHSMLHILESYDDAIVYNLDAGLTKKDISLVQQSDYSIDLDEIIGEDHT